MTVTSLSPTEPDTSAQDSAPKGPTLRSRVLNVARLLVGALVLVAVVVAVQRNWGAVSGELARLSPRAVGGAFVLVLASPVLTLLGWRALLADLGGRLPLPASASVFFVGQLGKYLPGSVWSVAIQSDMGGRLGVPRRTLGVAGLLSLGLAVLTAAVVGLPALPLLLRRGAEDLSLAWFALPVILMVVVLWPPVLNALVSRALRLIRREPLPHRLGGRAILTCSAWFVLAWLSMAAAVWVLAGDLALDASSGQLALTTLSGYCLAAGLGMLSVIVPAGVGVRDGILGLLLVGQLPIGAATAVVVVHRFLSVLVDVLLALAAFLWGRGHHLIGERT